MLSIASLIRPFHYCNELRPYFTIHDSDFKDLTTPFSNQGPETAELRLEKQRRTGLMLGVTNPFFCKTLNKVSFSFIRKRTKNQPINSVATYSSAGLIVR